jgi:hypothetical protein
MATKTIKLEIPFQKLLNAIDQLTPDEKLILKKRLAQRKTKKHSILEIEGLGAEVWKKVDVEDYIRKERESWD